MYTLNEYATYTLKNTFGVYVYRTSGKAISVSTEFSQWKINENHLNDTYNQKITKKCNKFISDKKRSKLEQILYNFNYTIPFHLS